MSLGVVRDLRSPRSLDTAEDAGAYQEHLIAEYVFARVAHGVLDATIRQDVMAIEEFLAWAEVWAWEVEPKQADRFLGQALRDRAIATRRGKATSIDTFYRFLEVRYRGEIRDLTGRVIASPIDAINRPTHTGDFSVRVPPSAHDLSQFFSGWRADLAEARKWLVASRNYTMARATADIGLRVRELCALALDDLHFEHGPLGKVHVRASARERVGQDLASASSPCWATPEHCSCGGCKTYAATSTTTGSSRARPCSRLNERDAWGRSRFAPRCIKRLALTSPARSGRSRLMSSGTRARRGFMRPA